jgi:hypothetical protein
VTNYLEGFALSKSLVAGKFINAEKKSKEFESGDTAGIS